MPSGLSGLKALVLEDDTLLGPLMGDMLEGLGLAKVTITTGVEEALAALAEERPDVAVLDLLVGQGWSYPVADALADAGIPFVFTTGFRDALSTSRHAARPVIGKPFTDAALALALERALART